MEAINQGNWPRWVVGAKQGIKTGVPRWLETTGLVGGVINGPTVTGGSLAGPPLLPFIISEMKSAGTPDRIVFGFMTPVAEAWSAWAASVSMPGLPLYPSFAMVPSPIAPPTPSTAAPLQSLTQVTAFLTPQVLSQKIKAHLGNDAANPVADAAINDFCSWLYAGFSSWRSIATLQGVTGTGPVPSFAPPYVPGGPVVGGTAFGGKITPPPFWP
jgi:hypothetical protein